MKLFCLGLFFSVLLPVSAFCETIGVVGEIEGEKVTIADIDTPTIHYEWNRLYLLLKIRFEEETIRRLGKKYPELRFIQKEVTEDEVFKFYEENGYVADGTYESQKRGIAKKIFYQKNRSEITRLFELAIQKGLAKNFLPPAAPMNVSAPFDKERNPISKTSKVVLIEFFDFQCKHCQSSQNVIQELLESYQTKMGYNYRHFPDLRKKFNYRSAIAAECVRAASNLHEFFKFKQRVFSEIELQYSQDLEEKANQLKIDKSMFKQCFEEEWTKEIVDNDMLISASQGFPSTPAFVIGFLDQKKQIVEGELLIGYRDLASFKTIIDKYINQSYEAKNN